MNIIATQRDLATGISFIIVGSLEDNQFLTKYYKFKQFLDKQKAFHIEKKEAVFECISASLIDYKMYPIVTTLNDI